MGRPPLKQGERGRYSHAAKARQALKKARSEEARKLEKVREKRSKLDEASKVLNGKQGLITTQTIIEIPEEIKKELETRPVAFQPNPGPQTEFLASSEREVFYGGARGGGKSYSLLVDPLRYCNKEMHRALIIRRTMPELRDLINHSFRLYKAAFPDAKWRDQEKEWRFPSGARIEFGYAETRQDALRYQGQSYTWIGVDELPQYPTPDIWNDLRGSLRSVDPTIPEYMRATGNPGNVGSRWVKEAFVNAAPANKTFFVEIELPDGTTSRISRRYIPARLSDNPYLTRTKSYMTMLASLPPTQRKQWLEGDWDAWDGAAFPEFSRQIHTCEPFKIPQNWIKFRACDWGYSSAAVCLWFAVDYENNLWVYRELKTSLLTADKFAIKVRELEDGERVRYGVMDASVWAKRGDSGPGIIETMLKEGVRWRPSDRSAQSRKNGKMEVHRRLMVNEFTHEPSIKIFNTCTNVINELPALPLDQTDPEDVDTNANDHSYDALRYGCMSRPLNPAKVDEVARIEESLRYQPTDTTFGY